jgi:hypothetical protein
MLFASRLRPARRWHGMAPERVDRRSRPRGTGRREQGWAGLDACRSCSSLSCACHAAIVRKHALTPNGSDIAAQIAAGGFFRLTSAV